MMKRLISIICILSVLCTVFGGMTLAEESSMVVAKEFTGESLASMGVENVSTYSDNALRSVLDEQGNVVAQPEEKAIGFSARMFANVYSMWGYCIPQYDDVKDITVELKASLYAFDDVNWTVKKDGFLQELHYEYSTKNVLGFMLNDQMQWIAGYEYDEAPVEYNAERGYYYKTFTFDYQDMASGVEGRVYHEWDNEMVYMSLVTHGITYYDSVTGEKLSSVDEDDCAYGTLDNLTGIVGDMHPYTDASCGEPLVNTSYPTFAVADQMELVAGDYVLQLAGELNTKVQVMAGESVLASERVTATAETPAELSFTLEEDAVCKVVIEQQDTPIVLNRIGLLLDEQSVAPPAPEVIYGDLNGDEKVDAKDALNVLKIAVGKLDATDEMKLVADVTGDGEINAKDALDILKKAVGKIEFFPVELKEDDPVDETVDKTNPLYGKTALFVGDSICYGQWDNEPRQGWAGRIATQYGMTVTNAGIGGTTISNIRSGRIVTQIHDNKNNSYDYVILQGGTNDGWGDMASTGSVPAKVGSIANSFDLKDFDITTFAGGLEELFYYTFEYFPNAKIGFMTTFATPLGASQNLGATGDMSEYYNIALKICEKWGVQCLDLFHDRYVSNTLMKVTTYLCLKDPLHPNATGYDNLAPYIGEWMTRMVDNDTYKANPYMNKRALFVGDSISYGEHDLPKGYSWAGRLQDSLGIRSDNQSCSGWSVSTIRGSQIVQQLQKQKNSQYDYIIMQGGINDSWDNAPVGVMTNSYNPDDFDRSTFAGALEHLFYSAYRYFPNARLGYIINFQLPAAQSDMSVYREIALAICEKWKVACYDMHADDAVTNALQPQNLTNMADVGHPNKSGYDILAPFIEEWFKTIPYADISSFEKEMPSIS